MVCSLNLSFICAFIAMFVIASMAHLYFQEWKHFENREYNGICTCGYSSFYSFQNLLLLMPLLLQILCTFEFTYSYTLIFVVFIDNNTNVCIVLSSLCRMLRYGSLEENTISIDIKMSSSLCYGRTQRHENHITMFFHNTRKKTF